ncbi:MAG: hypothetical protein LBP80_11605 [Treponema sp.]|jgi:hypothetical protein|nr:hypothetical protein [Treponema sp.]
MVSKNRFFLLVIFLLLCGQIFAQEQESEIESSFRLDESGRILQRISWVRSNAYYYEVEIERQVAAGAWQQVVKEKTEELFVEVSLAPGMYRYRILSYNVLGRVAATTEWAGIRVFATRDPKIERTIPEAYYVEQAADDFSLTLEGVNLMENADVYLISKEEGAGRIMPESIQYSEGENSITLVFRTAGLGLGPYDIVVTNPGKLQTVYEGFAIKFQQAVDVNVSLGYAPLIPLYGYIFDSFSSPLYPASFYARVNVVPLKRLWGFVGAEFTPGVTLLETKEAAWTVHGVMMSFAVDALYQYWFSNRTMALNARLGGGFAVITGIYYDHRDGSSSEPAGTVLPLLNTGVSFEWVFWKDLFAEAGLEYTQHFSSRSPAPGVLKFTAGVGWRF